MATEIRLRIKKDVLGQRGDAGNKLTLIAETLRKGMPYMDIDIVEAGKLSGDSVTIDTFQVDLATIKDTSVLPSRLKLLRGQHRHLIHSTIAISLLSGAAYISFSLGFWASPHETHIPAAKEEIAATTASSTAPSPAPVSIPSESAKGANAGTTNGLEPNKAPIATVSQTGANTKTAGETAYNQKDYTTAYQLLKPEAEAGDRQAQYYLGVMLRKGLGIDRDLSAAANWFTKAAKQGQREAINTLATLYRLGEGMPQDHQQALRWYQEAAKFGFENAQYRIALMYHEGLGVPKDVAEAYKWAFISAAQGGQPEPARLRDRLAKQLSPSQIQQAQREGNRFIAETAQRMAAEQAVQIDTATGNAPPPTAASSTDTVPCGQAERPVEKVICSDQELAELDETVAGMYRSGLTFLKGTARADFVREQQNWLKERDATCPVGAADLSNKDLVKKNLTCLKNEYVSRVEVLSVRLEGAGESQIAEAANSRTNTTITNATSVNSAVENIFGRWVANNPKDCLSEYIEFTPGMLHSFDKSERIDRTSPARFEKSGHNIIMKLDPATYNEYEFIDNNQIRAIAKVRNGKFTLRAGDKPAASLYRCDPQIVNSGIIPPQKSAEKPINSGQPQLYIQGNTVSKTGFLPNIAEIRCEYHGNNVGSLQQCFGSDASELKITADGKTKSYRWGNMHEIAPYGDVGVVYLPKDFAIFAFNADNAYNITVIIKNQDGDVLYEKQASPGRSLSIVN